jgi:hypothetical protein
MVTVSMPRLENSFSAARLTEFGSVVIGRPRLGFGASEDMSVTLAIRPSIENRKLSRILQLTGKQSLMCQTCPHGYSGETH